MNTLAKKAKNKPSHRKSARRALKMSKKFNNDYLISKISALMVNNFDIAHYFGVSIDWLMGNQGGSAIAAKSAAEFITRAVLCGAAKLTPYSVEEGN